jgi:hypothetical protein
MHGISFLEFINLKIINFNVIENLSNY